MAELKAKEDTQGIVSISSLAAFNKGDQVRVTDGAFAERIAEVQFMDDMQRVQVLLNFLGREIKAVCGRYRGRII